MNYSKTIFKILILVPALYIVYMISAQIIYNTIIIIGVKFFDPVISGTVIVCVLTVLGLDNKDPRVQSISKLIGYIIILLTIMLIIT